MEHVTTVPNNNNVLRRSRRHARIISVDRLSLLEAEGSQLADVFSYWQSTRGTNFAPSRSDFRLEDLPPRIVPGIAVVDFVGNPVDYYYRFFGSKMVQAANAELTGKFYYADDIEDYGFVNAEVFPRLIKEREPLLHKARWVSSKNLEFTTITLRLPLSNDGTSVDGAITANLYKLSGH